MQGVVKVAYEAIVPYGLRQDIKGYTRRRQYERLRQEPDAMGYYIGPYDKTKSIFVHIPKNAGISLCKSLYGGLGGGHLTARTYRVIFGPERFRDYFKFAIVRNPWDRLVSAYTFLKDGGLAGRDAEWARANLAQFRDFDDFVLHGLSERFMYNKLHFVPQWEYVCDAGGRMAMDYLGRYETLPQDYAVIAKQLGVMAELPKSNASKRGDFRRYYTDASVEKVARLYKKDVEIFGYSFEA